VSKSLSYWLEWTIYSNVLPIYSPPSTKLRIDGKILLNLKYNSLARLKGAAGKIQEL
jgi:hypothetical protein